MESLRTETSRARARITEDYWEILDVSADTQQYKGSMMIRNGKSLLKKNDNDPDPGGDYYVQEINENVLVESKVYQGLNT